MHWLRSNQTCWTFSEWFSLLSFRWTNEYSVWCTAWSALLFKQNFSFRAFWKHKNWFCLDSKFFWLLDWTVFSAFCEHLFVSVSVLLLWMKSSLSHFRWWKRKFPESLLFSSWLRWSLDFLIQKALKWHLQSVNLCIAESVNIWSCSQILVSLKVSELFLWESSFSILFLLCKCLSRDCFWSFAVLYQCCDLFFMLSLLLHSCCTFLLSQHIINAWKRLTFRAALHECWKFSSACFAVTQFF